MDLVSVRFMRVSIKIISLLDGDLSSRFMEKSGSPHALQTGRLLFF